MLDIYCFFFFLRILKTETQPFKPQHKVATRSEFPRVFPEYNFFFLFKTK